ncbi:MAG: permease-like cell division protein FtsX [Clostridia bacterium]|nr:permease-like cell division protein FtsX [Clostridia bacterium]
MKINSVKYFAKEATKNVFSNGWMSLASVFTVVASLLVFGLFLILTMNLNYMVTQIASDYEITLTVDENQTTEQITELENSLKNLPNVSEVIFESREERLNLLRQQFGDNASLLDRYQNEKNPLRHWFKVTCEDLTKSDQTVADIKSLSGVVRVISNGETIRKLTSASSYISQISIWIMVALGIISIFIISNTIKLAVFSRRKEINIMKYVGATDWFIRWPFIIEGIIIGVIGAVFSLLLIVLGYKGLTTMFFSLNIGFVKFILLRNLIPWLLLALLGMGIGLGAIGSFIAVRKHLKV